MTGGQTRNAFNKARERAGRGTEVTVHTLRLVANEAPVYLREKSRVGSSRVEFRPTV